MVAHDQRRGDVGDRAESSGPSPSSFTLQAAATPIVGRRVQLSTLEGCVRSAVSGRGAVALVEGAAGSGKTHLLQVSMEATRDLGTVVLSGGADELDPFRPFGPFDAALGSGVVTSKVLARLAPISGQLVWRPHIATSQQQVLSSLLAHLEHLASHATLVLVLDDLQWADRATLSVVHRLLPKLADLPIALLLACRPTPRSARLEGLVEELLEQPAHHLRLPPLDDDDVSVLVERRFDAPPCVRLLDQLRRAGGNPFYLHELLEALVADHAIEVVDGCAELVKTGLPATLHDTILRHLRYLDADATNVLELAAVLGPRLRAEELADLARRHAAELIAPLREGIEAGLLVDRPDGFEFRHDLVREALYGGLPAGLRGQLHLAAARTLAAAGAPALRIATHLAIGAHPGDGEAADGLLRAARGLGTPALELAERFVCRAVDVTLPGDPRRDELRTDMVVLLVSCGRPTAARALGEAILSGAPATSLIGRLRFALAQASYLQGDFKGATEQMELAAAHSSLTDAERSLVLAESGMVRLFASADTAGAETDAREALSIARRVGDVVGESMALCVLSGVAQFRGDISGSLAWSARAMDLHGGPTATEPGTMPSALRDPYMFHGMALLDADELDGAADAFRSGAAISEARGVAGGGHFYHFWLGYRHHLAGAWDDARAELRIGLSLASASENRRGSLAAHGLLGVMALHDDDLQAAARHIATSQQLYAAHGPDFGMVWMLLGDALLQEARGDPEAARVLLAGAWEMLHGLGGRFHYRTLGPELTRLAVATGERDLAEAVARSLAILAKEQPVPSVRGAAAHCRGLIDGDGARLLAAVDLLRSSPRQLSLAAALEDAAEHLSRDEGHRAETRRLFEEARAIYEQLPAHRNVARVVARMRAAGIRTGVRGSRGRPKSGWDSLTPMELRVVELVAEGLSNPQIGARLFTSRRTVQTHVSHVFRKLSLSSRSALAAEVARRSGSTTSEGAPL